METTKTKLEILASDILDTSYSNGKDCAITRALHRAGFKNLHDAGVEIVDEYNRLIITDADKDYNALQEKVLGMYSFKDNTDYVLEYISGKGARMAPRLEPKDFTVYLDLTKANELNN